jgi:hypothetical protein
MSARTVKVLVAEREVLDALADGPKSSREISEATYHAARKAWAEENGFDFDPDNPDDCHPVVKILGWSTAFGRGLRPMHPWQVDAVLRRLEKRGEVERVQIAGHRPMLWRLP